MPRVAQSGRIMPRYMGGSTSFNGSTSAIPTTLTSNDVFKTGNGFTMWRWINPKSAGEGGAGRLYDKSSGVNGADGFRLCMASSNRLLFEINAGSDVFCAVDAIKYNRWQLALVTVAADGTVTYYINGVASGTPAATSAPTEITAANPLTIGQRAASTASTFDGLMGEGGICPRVLTQAEITALYTTGALPTGTAHHWTLDEVTGVFADSIGGATGTGTDTAYSTDTPVQARKAVGNDRASLSFDIGANAEIDLTNTAVLEPEGSKTVVATVKLNRLDGSNTDIFGRQYDSTAGNDAGWRLRIYGSTRKVSFGVSGITSGNFIDASDTTDFKLNKWVTVVGVYDATDTSAKLYIDGQLVGSATITGGYRKVEGYASATKTMIGRYSVVSNTAVWDGNIKNVRIYDTALTASQVRDLHFSNIVPRTNLVGEWLLNEGAGTVAYDTSGNGNNGTITGATWSADVPNAPRQLIGGSMIKNSDFSHVPPFVAATTSINKWIDGTAAGSGIDIFPWAASNLTGSSFQFDTTVQYQGKNSMKLTSGAGALARIHQGIGSPPANAKWGIPATPGVSYTLTYWMKTELLSGESTGGAHMVLNQRNLALAQVTPTPGTIVNTTTDWTQYSIEITAAAATRYLYPEFRISGNEGAATLAMHAWFADIRLTPTTPTSRTAL